MMVEQLRIEPPCQITEFLDRLGEKGQRIVPGSLVWLPHPENPNEMVAAVMIEDAVPASAGEGSYIGVQPGGE